MVDGQRVGGIGLKLDRIRAGGGGGVDQRQRPLELAVMVAGQLSHDQWRVLGPDPASIYGNLMIRHDSARETRASCATLSLSLARGWLSAPKT